MTFRAPSCIILCCVCRFELSDQLAYEKLLHNFRYKVNVSTSLSDLVMHLSIPSGRRWENNIKIDLMRNTTRLDCIYLAQEGYQQHAAVKSYEVTSFKKYGGFRN
jgi:hypothetical protein